MDPVIPTQTVNQPETGAGLRMPVAPRNNMDDLSVGYLSAIKSKDPREMATVAEQARGTPLGEQANDALSVMKKNLEEYSPYMERIQKAGGIGTPQGNMQAVKEWQTNMDKPNFGRWLIGTLAGEPNAYRHLTGGVASTKFTYGDNGQMIKYKQDEVGDISNPVYVANNQPVSQAEWAKINAGALGEKLTTEKKTSEQKFNLEEKLAEDKKVQGYQAFAPIMRRFADDKQQLSQELIGSGLNADKVAYYLSFGKQKIATSESLSNAADKLGSITQGKTNSLSKEDSFGLATVLKPFGYGVDANGKVINKKGEEASKTELNQLQSYLNQSASKEASFDRTAEQAAMGDLFGPLSSKQQDRLLRLRELNDSFEKKMGDMRREFGTLPFLVETEPFSALTSPNRFSAQADVIRHNANIIDKFATDRAEQLKIFESNGQLPKAGQIMSAFTKTPAYDQSEKDLKEAIKKSMSAELITVPGAVESGMPGIVPEASKNRGTLSNPNQIQSANNAPKKPLPKASDVIGGILNRKQ